MLLFGLASAIFTAVYAVIFPAVSVHALAVAAGILFSGLVGLCCFDSKPIAANDAVEGVRLATVFCVYQYCIRMALQESTMAMAIVNTNVVFLGFYSMYLTNTYARACELFASSLMFILLSVFLATFMPEHDRNAAAAPRATREEPLQ